MSPAGGDGMTTKNGPTILIPARLGSTRLPGKVLLAETGKPLIVHVCEAAARVASAGRVAVATDSDEVASAVRDAGFEAVMTRAEHPNGTSRLAEAAETLGLGRHEIVVNVQGDEPDLDPDSVESAIWALHDTGADVSTLVSPFAPGEDPADPSIVKAVLGVGGGPSGQVRPALYFSRALVPHDRDGSGAAWPMKHLGLYCYTKGFLERYVALPPTPLEQAEKLEQLRVLEHGYRVVAAVRPVDWHGIDTAEDYRAFVERQKSTG